jgi:predicted CoA-binding protein
LRTWRDPEVIKQLLTTPATWAVVGLSANTKRTAYGIGQYLRDWLGMSIAPVNFAVRSPGSGNIAGSPDVPASIQLATCWIRTEGDEDG